MLRFSALGAIELTSEGREAEAVLRHPKRLLLFAYLLLARPAGFHRRDTLVALFWPELDHAHARAALRQALHYLRRGLGPEIVVTRGDEGVGVVPDAVACDVLAFRDHLKSGRLEAALGLYRGDLLPGLHVSGCAALDRWLEDERSELRRRALAAAAALLERAEQGGALPDAVRWARVAASLAPYDDATARQLVTLLDRAGQTGEALEAYEAFALRLAEDLELEVSTELRGLAQSIRVRALEAARTVPRTPPATGAQPSASAPPAAHTGEPASVPRTLVPGVVRRAAAAALAIAIIASVTALLVAFGRGDPAAEAVEAANLPVAERIAVLPFPVSGDPEHQYLRDGLAELLSSRLDSAGELRTVDLHAVLGSMSPADTGRIDPARGREIAQRLGAGWYVLGTLMESGGRLRAGAVLYDAAGVARGSGESLVADEGQVYALVDDLARQIVAAAPLPEARLTRLGLTTTESFPALKAYLQGESLLRRAQFDSAVAAYERAVAADSTFALAYYRMAVARQQDPTPAGPADAHVRALTYADRLAPRDRLLLRAFDAYQRHQSTEAERLYREIVGAYPDEIDAWFFLGQVLTYYELWRGRPLSEVRFAFESALRLDSAHLGALNYLSWLAAAEERFDEGNRIVERMLALQPEGAFAPMLRLRLAFARDDAAQRERLLAELPMLDSYTINWAFRSAYFSGHPDAQTLVAPVMIRPDRPDHFHFLGRGMQAKAALERGRWRVALAAVEHMRDVNPSLYPVVRARYWLRPFSPSNPDSLAAAERVLLASAPADPEVQAQRLYFLGLLRSRLGDPAGAERYARELDTLAAREDDADAAHRSVARTPSGGGRLDEVIELGGSGGVGRIALGGRLRGLARDLALGIRAWDAHRAGRNEEALAHLNRLQPEGWWIRAYGRGSGMDGVQSWLTAEVLVALGRDEEAFHYYAPLGMLWGDMGLLAPKHLRMAEIEARRGNRDRAAYHYGRVVELWSGCDPELAPIAEDARRRAEALGRLRR